MSNKKQSSIEWYANASHELIVKKDNGEITNREFLTMHHNLFYDAEAMHKEEVEASYADGYSEGYNRALELVKWKIDNEIKGGNNEQQ